jgi:serine/threonine protein kinase
MVAVPFQPSDVGSVLGSRYRLSRVIATGGMGTVYEANILGSRKRVAIKVMAIELSQDKESLARFQREADVTGSLGHPNIVQVHEFGMSDSGQPYLVMEYLAGEDLDQRLEKTPALPQPQAFRIAQDVASALSIAHAKGIVHRDLKPANIFLVAQRKRREFAKILDFGISKVQSGTINLTHGQTVLGTPYYMSPEQATARSSEVDHRTDQWALACITWQMLCGECPFQGDDLYALAYQVAYASPPPLTPLVPGLAPGVEPVLLRALSKNKNERYPSTADFARALREAAGDPPPTTLRQRLWTRKWSLLAGGILLALTAIGALLAPRFLARHP